MRLLLLQGFDVGWADKAVPLLHILVVVVQPSATVTAQLQYASKHSGTAEVHTGRYRYSSHHYTVYYSYSTVHANTQIGAATIHIRTQVGKDKYTRLRRVVHLRVTPST